MCKPMQFYSRQRLLFLTYPRISIMKDRCQFRLNLELANRPSMEVERNLIGSILLQKFKWIKLVIQQLNQRQTLDMLTKRVDT